jgi:hypothetical protein
MEKQAEYIYNNMLIAIESIMGNNSTSTSELNKYGPFFVNNYIGTYPRDKIPNLKNGESCIINLDPSTKEGSHWIALYKQKDIFLYDSFGRSRLLPELNYKESSHYDAEQSYFMLDCGQRCITWLLFVNLYGIDKALLI